MSAPKSWGTKRDEHIHCASVKADAADPAKIPHEFLFFTHPGHVLIILAAAIVADGRDSGGYSLVFENFVVGRHCELVKKMIRRKGSRWD